MEYQDTKRSEIIKMEETTDQVRVTGVPEKLKISALLRLMYRVNVRTKKVNVCMLPPSNGTKDVILTFPTNFDAQRAVINLDNYVMPFELKTYVINAYMEHNYHEVIAPRTTNKPKKFKWRSERDRGIELENQMQSQGWPAYNNQGGYRNESYALDKKIQILKKQRLILEEERKLLEEKKKLEKIRMQASNSAKGVNLTPNSKRVQQTPPTKSAKSAKKHSYFKATGVLVWKMSAHINKYAGQNKKAFLVRLRLAIRDRIRAAVNGEPIYYTNKVIEVYRKHHPESEDESFVKGLAEQLDDANLPDGDALTAECAKEGANAESDEKIENEPEAQDDKYINWKPFNRRIVYKVLNKLNPIIDKHVTQEKRSILVKLLRHVIRKRVVAIIDDKPITGKSKSINEYRDKYPVEKDEELVLEALKKMEDNNWDYDVVSKMYGPPVGEDGCKEADDTDADASASGADLYDPANPGEEDEDEKEDKEGKKEQDTNNVETEKDLKVDETGKESKVDETEKESKVDETGKESKVDETGKESKVDETKKDSKVDVTGKESTENTNGTNTENRGIKRSGSVVEGVEGKVAKVSDGNENDFEITNENDLEDWN